MRVIVSGGGTGGHVYPALVIASYLRQNYDADILYVGGEKGIEEHLAPAAGFALETIRAGKLNREFSCKAARELARVPVGMADAWRVVRRFRPDVVFTSGGYVAVPTGLAARSMRAPLWIHQQDIPMNLANRILAPVATTMSVAFEASLTKEARGTRGKRKGGRGGQEGRVRWTGNPMRPELDALAGTPLPTDDPPLLTVLGGSLGSVQINHAVTLALPALLPRARITHICGPAHLDVVRAESAEAAAQWPGRYRVEGYIEEDLPALLAASTLVICRAGASTLAELALLGRPCLLIPLHSDLLGSPQMINARAFSDAGAAVSMEHVSADELARNVLDLLADRTRLLAMAAAIQELGKAGATEAIAAGVAALAGRRQ